MKRLALLLLVVAAIPALIAACSGDTEVRTVEVKVYVDVPALSPAQAQGQESNPIPATTEETWIEPWVWRPSDWPGQQLDLNVVENENPGGPVGLGNPSDLLFSYGGQTPGPTVRMRGDETLLVKLRNLLGEDFGTSYVHEYPDPLALVPGLTLDQVNEKAEKNKRRDLCLGEHTNGQHSAHVTNLHTHGLHVRPGTNPNGTQSDNILLRVMPQADYDARLAAEDRTCQFLRFDEQVGEADYEIRLGNVMENQMIREGKPPQPHPPGTHWYHPHSHGSTHNQVASGMAGFLIIEGDVDDNINQAMTGQLDPNPELKSGPYDYRERLIFMQRVLAFNRPSDPDAPPQSQRLKNPPIPTINGSTPQFINMRPGAVERWRVLNGSVDGRGYKRFMVLEGQYVWRKINPQDKKEPSRLYQVLPNVDNAEKGDLKLVTRQNIEDAKENLYELAMDGITLVVDSEYTIKDLKEQNAGITNPLAGPIGADNPNADMLENFEACFKDEASINNCYVRPNEVYLAPANRTDVFFQAPVDSTGKIYTILAKAVVLHADNYQQNLQANVNNNTLIQAPEEIIIAYVVVTGDQVPEFDVMSLVGDLPPVPPYLLPIESDELIVGDEEILKGTDVEPGSFRTRTVNYSGWGAADYPLITVPDEFSQANPDLKDLTYGSSSAVNVLMPPDSRTLAIDGRKFDEDELETPHMLIETAEEWAVYNSSIMLWGNTDTDEHPQAGQYNDHYTSYPVSRKEGQDRFHEDNQFRIVTKGVDHPFHIHTNPAWVMRIEIPDENGVLHNILPEPRWQDVIWLPRNGGRVVFRSRFPDYVGKYVNHCHILLHEDNGMMQVVQTTQFAEEANYVLKNDPEDFAPGRSLNDVNDLYPPPTLEEHYRNSIGFVDPNPNTGQTYPGFEVAPPILQ